MKLSICVINIIVIIRNYVITVIAVTVLPSASNLITIVADN